MKCGDCSLWKAQEDNLKKQMQNLIPSLALISTKKDLARLQILANYCGDVLDGQWRRLVELMDNECPKEECILVTKHKYIILGNDNIGSSFRIPSEDNRASIKE